MARSEKSKNETGTNRKKRAAEATGTHSTPTDNAPNAGGHSPAGQDARQQADNASAADNRRAHRTGK